MTLEHDRFSELLGGYARGRLDQEQAREVEAHLASCDGCRAELAALRAMIGAEPAPLTDAQKASLARHAPTSVAPPRPVSFTRTSLLAVAAAIVLIAVGFVYLGQGGGSSSSGSASSAAGRSAAKPRHVVGPADRITFDYPKGPITTTSLRRLAAAGSFNSVLSPDRSNAQPDQSFSALYANRLEQVKACERQVTAARGNSPKLVYAGFGHDDKGRNVSALGFVYSAKKGSPADHYAFWVWRVGKCSSTPELYVSGMLKR